MHKQLSYQTGFGNHFATEARSNTLPQHQNTPQSVAHGLYTEQVSGTAFTAPRANNRRSWLYRMQPSVGHGEFQIVNNELLVKNTKSLPTPPTQMRWDPIPAPTAPTDFLNGLIRMASNGSTKLLTGAAIYHYHCNDSMHNCYFYNADGELLIIPQQGSLLITTELGLMTVAPEEIAVIPRGIKFKVDLQDKTARGYVCENFGAAFALPELGPIGANGLANPRDFQTPCAAYEEKSGELTLYCKFQENIWQASIDHSPFDVVAWHGNHVPYKYNLNHFNTINTVSFDHSDPSIFTVLTSQSNTPGVANIDFVIFPERWQVAEHSFRPAYYHRNIMNEYMGLIKGEYDAKPSGFVPGGASLHNCMSAHGPDATAYQTAVNANLKPEYISGTLAFMLESYMVWQASEYALTADIRQKDYLNCWQGLKKNT